MYGGSISRAPMDTMGVVEEVFLAKDLTLDHNPEPLDGLWYRSLRYSNDQQRLGRRSEKISTKRGRSGGGLLDSVFADVGDQSFILHSIFSDFEGNIIACRWQRTCTIRYCSSETLSLKEDGYQEVLLRDSLVR